MHHIVVTLDFHPDVYITVSTFPWKSPLFKNMFNDAKLVDLCAASVTNICQFIIETHKAQTIEEVRKK